MEHQERKSGAAPFDFTPTRHRGGVLGLGRYVITLMAAIALALGIVVPVQSLPGSPGTAEAQAQTLAPINSGVADFGANGWQVFIRVSGADYPRTELTSIKYSFEDPTGTPLPETGWEVSLVYPDGSRASETATVVNGSENGRATIVATFTNPIYYDGTTSITLRNASATAGPTGTFETTTLDNDVLNFTVELNPAPVVADPIDLNATPAGGADSVMTALEQAPAGQCVAAVSETPGATVYVAKSDPSGQSRDHTQLFRQEWGSTEFVEVGAVTPWVYNALAYNSVDGYIYAISQNHPISPDEYPMGHLLRISPNDGSLVDLGPIEGIDGGDVSGGITNGAFDLNGDYIFSNNSLSGTGDVYKILFGSNGNEWDLNAENTAFNANLVFTDPGINGAPTQLSANDWATVGFESSPYVWSLNARDGRVTLWRTNIVDGGVTPFDVTDLTATNSNQGFITSGVYGTAWTYGNGNLGFGHNGAGRAYQISVDNPESANPTFELVSVTSAPTQYNNDATSNAYMIQRFETNDPDLEITKEMIDAPEGQVAWRVTVTNLTDCPVSGFTVNDAVPTNAYVDGSVTVTPETPGWFETTTISATDQTNITYSHGALTNAEPATFVITATPRTDATCVANEATVTSPDAEADLTNNSASDGICDLRIEKNFTETVEIDGQKYAEYTVEVAYPMPTFATSATISGTKNYTLVDDPQFTTLVTEDAGVRVTGAETVNAETGAVVPGAPVVPFNGSPAAVAGGYQIVGPDENTLQIGEAHVFTIQVPYTVVEGADLASESAICAAADPLTPGNGLYNEATVTSGGDTFSDDACGPVEEPAEPEFAVNKTGQDTPAAVAADGTWSAEYTVEVSNTGTVDGTSAAVQDTVDVPAGFEVTEVTVDGIAVTLDANGSFELSAGEPIAAGAAPVIFTVVVNGTADVATVDWATVGVCDASTLTDPNAGGAFNQVTMEGDSDAEGDANNWACVPFTEPGTPVLDLVKRINGFDANTVDSAVVVAPGDVVVITFEVSNTGDAPAYNVTVTDDVLGAENVAITPEAGFDGTLEAGASTTFTAEYTIPAGASDHVNTATVTGTTTPNDDPDNPNDNIPPTSDEGHAGVPEIEIVKSIVDVDGTIQDANALPGANVTIGEDMTIDMVITNTGAVALENLTLSDDTIPALQTPQSLLDLVTAGTVRITNQPTGFAGTLEPGQSLTVRLDIPAPATAGDEHTNVATITGDTTPRTPEAGDPTPTPPTTVEDDDPANATGVEPDVPALEIVKRINGFDAETAGEAVVVKPGDEITVTFEVTNSGTATAVDVAVNDSVFGAIPAPVGFDGTLAVGDTVEFSTTHIVAEDETTHVNVATATGTPEDPNNPGEPDPNEPPVESTPNEGHYAVSNIDITKLINGVDANTEAEAVDVTAGQLMTVTYQVENTGGTVLNDVTFTDVISLDGVETADAEYQAALAAALANFDGTLDPQETLTVEFEVAAPAADVLHTNVVTVEGTPPTTPGGGEGDPTPTPPTTVEDDDPANATGVEPGAPILALEKQLNGDDADDAANPVAIVPDADGNMRISYVIANTGTGTAFDVQIVDEVRTSEDVAGLQAAIDAELATIPAFNLAENEVRVVDVTVPAPEGANEVHHNVAKVTATPPDPTNPDEPGNPDTPVESPEDPAHGETPGAPQLIVEKRINGDDADAAPGVELEPGQPFEITYVMENTGTAGAFDIQIADTVTAGENQAGIDALQAEINAELEGVEPFDLAAGATHEVTVTATAPESNGVQHTNVATISGTPEDPENPGNPDENPDTPPVESPEDPGNGYTGEPVTPALELVKLINGEDANEAPGVTVEVGAPMTISYVVTNVGQSNVTGIEIEDDVTAGAEAERIDADIKSALALVAPFDLAAGASETVTITVAAADVAGDLHTNVAKATGETPDPNNPDGPGTPVESPEDPGNATTVEEKTPPTGSGNPVLELEKQINGDDADNRPGVALTEGAPMRITYNVTNTGDAAAYNVALQDRVTVGADRERIDQQIQAALGLVPAFDLGVGQSKSVTITVTAPTQNDDQHTNWAKAVGEDPEDPNNPDGPNTPVESPEDPGNGHTGNPPTYPDLGDFVWEDENYDGIQDEGEPGIPGVTVTLTNTDTGETFTTTTDENGNYTFEYVEPGNYTVTFEIPEGYEVTVTGAGDDPERDSNGRTTTITVVEGQDDDLSIDFGVIEQVPGGSADGSAAGSSGNDNPGSSALGRCVENTSSISNPVAWLIPLGILVALGSQLPALNIPIFNEAVAEFNAKIRENTPDFGFGNIAPEKPQWMAEIEGQLAAVNSQLIQIDPRAGQLVVGLGLIAAGLAATTLAWDACLTSGYIGSSIGDPEMGTSSMPSGALSSEGGSSVTGEVIEGDANLRVDGSAGASSMN